MLGEEFSSLIKAYIIKNMEKAIEQFHTQFGFMPVIENKEKLPSVSSYIVCGMGGSNLAPGLIKMRLPEKNILSHRDYGLPSLPKEYLAQSLIIASSYSGNTEETIDSFKTAIRERLPVAVIATGGTLLSLARENAIPFVEMPDTGIQPRSALGYSLRALLVLMGEYHVLNETAQLTESLDTVELRRQGEALAERLTGKVPIIYSSTVNLPIAYNWKIKYNETGKIPSFYNVLPELNHNEMTGFDVTTTTRELSERFYFHFLMDPDDHPHIGKRMNALFDLFEVRQVHGEKIFLTGKNIFEKIFNSLVCADWAAFTTATKYGLDPEQVPMIEEFKKRISA